MVQRNDENTARRFLVWDDAVTGPNTPFTPLVVVVVPTSQQTNKPQQTYTHKHCSMSTIYATEPATTGRVVLETTHGPLDLELWCRECPTATHFFLQLLLDGFYNDTLVMAPPDDTDNNTTAAPSWIQGGAIRRRRRHEEPTRGSKAPTKTTTTTRKSTGTTLWESSIGGPLPMDDNDTTANTTTGTEPWIQTYYPRYSHGPRALERQRYELHSRLRFHRRGLVAMALPVDTTSHTVSAVEQSRLQAQFFITLQETPHLDGHHVIVGRLAGGGSGPTMFNALRMGQTGSTGDYEDAPRITSSRILDASLLATPLVPTPDHLVPWKQSSLQSTNLLNKKHKKSKRRGTLNVNVLSFGEECQEEEEKDEVRVKPPKSKKAAATLVVPVEEEEDHNNNKEEETETKARRNHKDPSATNHSSSEPITRIAAAKREPPVEQQQHPRGETHNKTQPSPFLPDNNNHVSRTDDDPTDVSAPPGTKTNHNHTMDPSDTNHKNRKPPKKLNGASLLQAMRSQSQFAAGSRRSTTSLKQKKAHNKEEDRLLSKLSAFQSRLSSNSSNTPLQQTAATKGEGSLADRMNRRAQEQAATAERQRKQQEALEQEDGYHGQVHDRESMSSTNWMTTHFQCRKHMDLAASDGRRSDDYQVVDDRSTNHKRKRRMGPP